MTAAAPDYDHYHDMLETHNEIGYLLVLLLSLLVLALILSAVLWFWPRQDVYLVPGTTAFGETGVVWNVDPPVLSAVAIPVVHPPEVTEPAPAAPVPKEGEAAPGASAPSAPAAPAVPSPAPTGTAP